MNNYERAIAVKDEIIENRRYIHQLAETGLDTVKTAAYIIDELTKMGYTPTQLIENSVVATVGKGEKTILLRADIDALPFPEQTGLPYAATNGNMHACGHDSHAAMLLGAAKILKEQEDQLKGTVKLMFQPGEEIARGASMMVEAGVLENPKVDCAMMIHINSTIEEGLHMKPGAMYASVYNFRIIVTGKGCHGAYPENGKDPILAAAHVLVGLQEILSREVAFSNGGVLTVGYFKAGSAANVIPEKAVLEGTMRTFNNETYYYGKKRLEEIAASIAGAFRCEVTIEEVASSAVCINDDNLVADMKRYIAPIAEGNFKIHDAIASTGGEDFAAIAERVPSCVVRLGAPDQAAEQRYGLHNPKMTLNEEDFPIGSAIFAECAMKWLEEHA